ncbi:MAG: histidinol-phosphate transaminase [Calditrichaeota bacterium]|nr:histidinol-phosphate transaminase [Calditrichota bacterium]
MIERFIKPHILNMKPYVSARSIGSTPILMDANESPFGDSLNRFNRYPDPNHRKLRSLLAERENLAVDQILISNGSDEALDLLFKATISPGDQIMAMYPSYGMYRVFAEMYNAYCRTVDLDSQFDLDLRAIESAKSNRLKLICLCHPNNPTGNCLSIDRIETVLKKADALVLVDEAYIDFCPEKSVRPLLEIYPNLIISRTFSKAYALAGLRVGYLLANSRLVQILQGIKLPYNINSFSLKAAEDVFERRSKICDQIDSIINTKSLLIEALRQFKWIDEIYPSDANFVLIKTAHADDFYAFCLQQGISLRKLSDLPDCLRISIGSPNDCRMLINCAELFVVRAAI